MVLSNVFPSLFADAAVLSANFGSGTVVEKSPVNPGCVIIRDSAPVAWFVGYLVGAGFGAEVIDMVDWRWNTDGSISVWEIASN